MKKIYFPILACLLLFTSCDKAVEPTTKSIKNEIVVKVYNAKTWSLQTPKMDTIVGATVTLNSDSGSETAISNNEGIATFTDVKEKYYYLVATKDNMSNLINKVTLEGNVYGNLIIGVYNTQAEIDYSPKYPNSVVGGVKLSDVNADGIVNNLDRVKGSYLKYEYKYQDLNADGLIDVKDLLNGSLVNLDNQIKISIFVGN